MIIMEVVKKKKSRFWIHFEGKVVCADRLDVEQFKGRISLKEMNRSSVWDVVSFWIPSLAEFTLRWLCLNFFTYQVALNK